jgi:hypothetical protein
MSLVPKLPTPSIDELYARFVDLEFNCLACPYGNKTAPGMLTSHITWVYQAVSTLEKGDVCMFGGDFQFFDSNPHNPYYPGGFLKALMDAMSRGATVIHIIDRFYVGGRDKNGNCWGCKNKGKPYGCDAESTKGSLYGKYICEIENYYASYLSYHYPNNYVVYDIPNQQPSPHSHLKVISFYMPSSNRCSVFKGSWNIATGPYGAMMKETGFGFTAALNSEFGKTHLFRDYWLLKVLENFYNYFTKFRKMSPTLYAMLDNKLPKSPVVVVPTVYFCGPDYCDPNFGCGAAGARGEYRCTAEEKYLSGIDTNVKFTFGLDPKPGQAYPKSAGYWDLWPKLGWPKFFPFGFDLLLKLINNSEKFLKTMIWGGALESNVYTGQPGYVEAVTKKINTPGFNWFCLENDLGWEYPTARPESVFNLFKNRKNFYAKIFGFCGRNNKDMSWKPFTPNPGGYAKTGGVNWILTHDKMWITDKGFLLSSAHPIALHYTWIMNEDLLVENCPSMLDYMNNHFNMEWKNCGFYPSGYIPPGPLKNSVLTCPTNNDSCCSTPEMSSTIKSDTGNKYGVCLGKCTEIHCGEHGTCVRVAGKEKCICKDGYKGKNCEINPCKDVKCGKHGTCEKGVCVCKDGYKGKNCEINPCKGVKCGKHGTCVEGICVCRDGYKGKNCEINPCKGVKCGKHGTCVEGICKCEAGYEFKEGKCTKIEHKPWEVIKKVSKPVSKKPVSKKLWFLILIPSLAIIGIILYFTIWKKPFPF